MNPIAQTPRLYIRLFKAEEEDTYLTLFDDDAVTLYLPKRNREELAAAFRDNLVATPGMITGRWGIFNKQDDDMIGMCLLRPFDDDSGSIELGYVLHAKYWGKGIASEMAEVLLAHAVKNKPDAKFVAVTDLDNIPSQRVLEKVGMRRTGNYVRHNDELALFRR